MTDDRVRGAIFIDLHDVLPHLESESRDPIGDLEELIDSTRAFLTRKVDTQVVKTTIFADLEVLSDTGYTKLADRLYRRGVESQYICLRYESLDTNVSMSLDICKTVHARADINRIVVISGSREYIPLFRSIQSAGIIGTLISFADEIPAALKATGSFDTFISANDLIKGRDLNFGPPEEQSSQTSGSNDFHEAKELPYDMDREALRIIELNFGHYEEVYLSPLLRKLSETIDSNSGHEPKTVISDLNRNGAIRLEKRRGEKYDYTVLIVNSGHPDVLAVREEVAEARIAGYHKDEDSKARMEEPGVWEQDFADMWESVDDDQTDDNT